MENAAENQQLTFGVVGGRRNEIELLSVSTTIENIENFGEAKRLYPLVDV